MTTQPSFNRRRATGLVAVIGLVVSTVLFLALPASAEGQPTEVTQTGGTLQVVLGSGNQSAKISVDNGTVTGEVDGFPISAENVQELMLFTATELPPRPGGGGTVIGGGEDKVELDINLTDSSLAVTADGSLIFSNIETSTRATLNNSTLAVNYIQGTKHALEAETSGTSTVTFGGSGGESVDVSLQQLGGDLTTNFNLAMGDDEDEINVKVEGSGNSTVGTLNIDTADILGDEDKINISYANDVTLAGTVVTGGSEDSVTISSDGDLNAVALSILAGNADDEVSVSSKGTLSGSVTISGEAGSDKLSISAGGGSGDFVIDGSDATFFNNLDECEASGVTATFVGCELQK